MIVGVDVINEGSRRLVGCSASYNSFMSQYYTRLFPQKLGEGKSKDEQETNTTLERQEILKTFFKEAIEYYQNYNKGSLPTQIIMYRDGMGGPTLIDKVLRHEVKFIVDYLETFT